MHKKTERPQTAQHRPYSQALKAVPERFTFKFVDHGKFYDNII